MGLARKTPPLAPDRLPNFRPSSLVEGLWDLGYMAVAPRPGAALSNHLLFIPFRDRRTSHVMMAGRLGGGIYRTGDVIDVVSRLLYLWCM